MTYIHKDGDDRSVMEFLHDGDVIPVQSGARRASAAEHSLIEGPLLEISTTAGTPVPSLWILDDDIPNAFATGFHEAEAAVTLTSGLLGRLDRPELRAVLAHEVGHIALGHIARNTDLALRLAEGATLATAATAIVGGAVAAATDTVLDDLFMGIVTSVVAASSQQKAFRELCAHQRATELEADDFAALIGGDHLALGQALESIDRHVATLSGGMMADWQRLLCIVEPVDEWSTHPPTSSRIAHAEQWSLTAAVVGWTCRGCAFGEQSDSRYCRRCGLHRGGTAGACMHDPLECPPAAPDGRHCTACGEVTVASLDLRRLLDRRVPTPLGLRPERSVTPGRLLPRVGKRTVGRLASSELIRSERLSLSSEIKRADALLQEDESPLKLSACSFTTAQGRRLDGLALITSTRLVAVGASWHDSMALDELEIRLLDSADDVWVHVEGVPLGLRLSGSGATGVRALLRLVHNQRAGMRMRVIY